MVIYPKMSSDFECDEMVKMLQNSEGTEIQFFDENGITSEFDFESGVRKAKLEYPNLKEIVVHPPLNDYNIEILFLKDENIVRNQMEKLRDLSSELGIELSFIYHTGIPVRQYISTGLDTRLLSMLKIIEGCNVTILIENLFMMIDEKEECSAIEICRHLNHPNLKCCLDTTHLHCKANILKKDFYTMIKDELNPDDCQKYIKQIHFASALNGDGYIDKRTHGRKHESMETLKQEYDWLVELGLKDKHFVTEVAEDDYSFRDNQLEEIRMLKELE